VHAVVVRWKQRSVRLIDRGIVRLVGLSTANDRRDIRDISRTDFSRDAKLRVAEKSSGFGSGSFTSVSRFEMALSNFSSVDATPKRRRPLLLARPSPITPLVASHPSTCNRQKEYNGDYGVESDAGDGRRWTSRANDHACYSTFTGSEDEIIQHLGHCLQLDERDAHSLP